MGSLARCRYSNPYRPWIVMVSSWYRSLSTSQTLNPTAGPTLTPPPLATGATGSAAPTYHPHPCQQQQPHRGESSVPSRRRVPPLLMMSSPSNPETRYLYELTADHGQLKRKEKLELPKIAGHLCIGSSQGYLLTVPPAPQREPVPHLVDIFATDPLTGFTLPLPSLHLPQDHYSSYLPPDPEDGYVSVCLPRKAFLSPSLDTLFLLCNGTLSIASSLGSDSAPRWTVEIDGLDGCNHDCILYKGRIYSIGIMGDLVICNPDDTSEPPIYVEARHPSFKYMKLSGYVKNYLVTSPDGEDLFMLLRSRNNRAGAAGYPDMTNLFMVFKLLKGDQGYYWDRIFDLGGLAIFVGVNYSVSYYSSDFAPLLKPNSIHFTDDFTEYLSEARSRMIGDSGVFTIEDGRTEIYEQSRDNLLLYWPSPVWLLPRDD